MIYLKNLLTSGPYEKSPKELISRMISGVNNVVNKFNNTVTTELISKLYDSKTIVPRLCINQRNQCAILYLLQDWNLYLYKV